MSSLSPSPVIGHEDNGFAFSFFQDRRLYPLDDLIRRAAPFLDTAVVGTKSRQVYRDATEAVFQVSQRRWYEGGVTITSIPSWGGM